MSTNNNSELSDINSIREIYNEKYFEELAQRFYNDDRNYPENFSNWYPYIKDFGKFKTPKVISNQILSFSEMQTMEKVETEKELHLHLDTFEKWLEPTLEKMKPGKQYHLKNGCFSNKFDYQTCIVDKYNLAENLWKINYMSACFDTGGFTELVVRELIPFNKDITPKIYNGMPLREELRVFYDIDKKELLYIEDYWNYEYCYNNITELTDRIIFDWFHNKIGNRGINHSSLIAELKTRLKNDIQSLNFEEKLKGKWSIDFLYNEIDDSFYLIDMARAERSAYWKE